MAKLIYPAIASLDGYTADGAGNFDWAVPDEAVHTFINDRERPIGTYLYGRRMYEVMRRWETDPSLAATSPVMRAFAEIWQAADKIVYSRSLARVSTARTRIERDFAERRALLLQPAPGRCDVPGAAGAAGRDGQSSPQIPAFRGFQANLKRWGAEPPVPEQLTVVGSYRAFLGGRTGRLGTSRPVRSAVNFGAQAPTASPAATRAKRRLGGRCVTPMNGRRGQHASCCQRIHES
jgi:hypothetical protein